MFLAPRPDRLIPGTGITLTQTALVRAAQQIEDFGQPIDMVEYPNYPDFAASTLLLHSAYV